VTGRAGALVAVAVLALAAVAVAADDRDREHDRDRDRGRDRARTFFVLKVVDALDLPDDKALALRGILRHADERRAQLVQQREAVQSKLRAALDAKPRDPAVLTPLVTEANDLDRQIATVPEDSFAEAQKILTVEQQAKLLLLRRELQGEVRQAMKRRLATPPHRAGTTPPSTSPAPASR